MRLAHTPGFRLASPEAAAKEGLLGGQGILAVQMGAEDSLLMRCGRRLAEGALSKGSRSSNTGPLSGHRGDSHCPPAAPVPSAQARPGTSHSLREDRDSWGKGTLRHSLAGYCEKTPSKISKNCRAKGIRNHTTGSCWEMMFSWQIMSDSFNLMECSTPGFLSLTIP